jgi:outer membrane receptor protein involved in Fe transport
MTIQRSPSMISRSARLAYLSSVAAVVLSTPVFAQAATPESAENDSPDASDIVVTGSRITGTGFRMPTPVTVLGADDLAKTGVTSVGEIMKELPSMLGSTTPASTTLSSQNAGAAVFNLRGLGASRNLLLVNGRRFVPTTTQATVDTNVIPVTLIDRVEVVTGGASAAYGSDAVSGVINIVLKKNLDGLVGTLQSGISTYGDNGDLLGSIGWGKEFADGRGHFSIAIEGQNNKGVTSANKRPWSARAPGLISNPAYTATNGQYRQFILDDFQLANASVGGLINSGNLKGTQFLPGGATAPFNYGQYAAGYQIGGGGVNAGRQLSITVPFNRYTVYSVGNYDLGPVTAYYEASYSHSQGKTNRLIPAFHLGNITIQNDNAYLPAAVASAMTTSSFTMGRLDTDLPPIGADDSNRTTRLVGGFKGPIAGSWTWSAYGEYGHTFYHSLLTNNINVAKYNQSIDAVRNAAGQIVCRVNQVTATAPNCSPTNIFGTGSPLTTPAGVAYFTGTTDYRVKIDERVGSGSLQGELFDVGGKPVAVAAGVEYRRDAIVGTSDDVSQAGGWLLGNPRPMKGSYDVKEAFGEIEIPLFHDRPFAQALGINGAVRATDYSTSGTVLTWKVGSVWQISDDVLLRVTRSRDIRAPNFDELFTNTLYRFFTVTDPFNNNQQLTVSYLSQGNRALAPETANTLTGGIVLTPRFIPGFRMSVDGYNIEISDAITTLGAQDIVTRCFAGNTALCNLLTRNASGTLTTVTAQYINVAKISTRGLDIEAVYRLPLSQLGAESGGALTFRGLGTYVQHLITNDGRTAVDRAGDVGTNNGGVPHWTFNISTTYENGPFTAFLQGRYIGSGKYNVTYGPLDIADNNIPARFYLDTSIAYTVINSGRQNVEMYFNINNLLDKDPPANPYSFFAPQATNPVLYNVVGRQFSLGVRFKF